MKHIAYCLSMGIIGIILIGIEFDRGFGNYYFAGAVCVTVAFFYAIAIFATFINKETTQRQEAEIQRREAELKKKKLEMQTEREQKEKQLAHMEGLEKYRSMDDDDARKRLEGIVALRTLGDIMQHSVYQEKEKDWAILGGFAEGIAGPAAGIAAAANAIQENARIKAENAARKEWGAKQNASFQDLASQIERKKTTAEVYPTGAILSWAPSTLISLLKLSDTKIDVDAQTGAVTVSTSWYQNDKSICIDGSLRAKIYTNSGECAGCAYLVLPKTGTTGFKGHLSGICARPKPSASYTVKIEPSDLWEFVLDRNTTSRKTDNLTIAKHRKLVSDCEAEFLAELGDSL